jgi:hypothetical protein
MKRILFFLWWTALVVLLTLKGSGTALSWWIVLAPIYAPVLLILVFFVAALVLVAVAESNARSARSREP